MKTPTKTKHAHCNTCEALPQQLLAAEQKAWDALTRYKFMMFGYWAAIWVHLNHLSDTKQRNPFAQLVTIARQQRPESK
jgi:hypothetical protein